MEINTSQLNNHKISKPADSSIPQHRGYCLSSVLQPSKHLNLNLGLLRFLPLTRFAKARSKRTELQRQNNNIWNFISLICLAVRHKAHLRNSVGLTRQPAYKKHMRKTFKRVVILSFICSHRIVVLHRIANPGPPGLAGSIPAVSVKIEPLGLKENLFFFRNLLISCPSVLATRRRFLLWA